MRTDAAVMVAAAGHVADVNSEVQSELSLLRTRVAAVEGAWQGRARGAFDGLMARWNEESRRLQESLAAIGENIRANGLAYDQQQDDHTRTISAAAGPLAL